MQRAGRIHSLKHKLMIFLIGYILVFLVFVGFLAMDTTRAARDNRRVYLRATLSQMAATIQNSVSNTAFFAYTLSRNDNVQSMFSAGENIAFATRRRVEEYMSQNGPFLYLNTGILNAVFLDALYRPFYSTYYPYEHTEMYAYLSENAAIRNLSQQGDICVTNRAPDTSDAPTFLYAIDVYNTQLDKDGNRRVGTIVLLCSLEKYREKLIPADAVGVDFAIRDRRGVPLLNNARGNTAVERDVRSIDGTPWRIEGGIVPGGYDISLLLSSRNFAIVMAAFALLAYPGLALLLQHYITRPIDVLIDEIRGLRPGKRLPVGRYREVESLSSYINAMLEMNDGMTADLLEQHTRIQELEILKARTELSALQSQINPHFLYNTLECVRSIALVNGIDSIQAIVSAMADLFRYSIKGPEVVRVADEVAIIEEYLKIVAVRFSGRYTSRVEIEPRVMEMQIFKMILQPLVENAVFHGLEKKRRGAVAIGGRCEGDNVVFTVQDDGGSFSPERLTQIQRQLAGEAGEEAQGESVGLLNIHRKIRLYYGAAYGLDVACAHGQGTTVRVVLPIRPVAADAGVGLRHAAAVESIDGREPGDIETFE